MWINVVETKRYVGETKELQVVASVRFRNRVKVPRGSSVVLIFARKSRSFDGAPFCVSKASLRARASKIITKFHFLVECKSRR